MNQDAPQAIGMIELSSIGIGHLVEDAMLKAAEVRLLLGRTICSGKYIVAVAGNVAPVNAAVEAALNTAPDGIIDHLTLPNVHPDVFPALGQQVQLTGPRPEQLSIGIIETFSAASALEAADAAAKASHVQLYRLHLAMALGGKGFVMFAGSVADCRAAVEAGSAPVKEKGLLVSAVVISRPSRELFNEYL